MYDQVYQVDHVDQIDPAHQVDDIDELADQNVIGSRFGRPDLAGQIWPANQVELRADEGQSEVQSTQKQNCFLRGFSTGDQGATRRQQRH